MRVQTVASGPGWHVRDVMCSAGPHSRPFEEQHEAVCIAAVLHGSFQYRTTQGAATLAPGAVLLGNHGHCFECGHAHATGDHCLSFQFDPTCFETILKDVPKAGGGTFPIPRLPPLMTLAPLVTAAETERADPGALEEIAFDLAGEVMSLLADQTVPDRAPTIRDQQRIATALHRIEADSQNELPLADLARDAGMSRYHFLRTFRQVVGTTPHQFILRTRLRTAAIELRRSVRPILDIALDAGFGDLSTFNRRFRMTMGVSPSRYRLGR
ncbi:MAG TPA: AraC family transcriptional regulator [Rhodopila sp.]